VKFLLDTNVLSEPMKRTPNPGVLSQLATHSAAIALAAPTWHEMLRGALRLPRGKKRRAILDYLENRVFKAIPILPYDHFAARWHAEQRALLETVGVTPPYVDGQIAAVAAVNGLGLVTGNTRDFTVFQDLEVADWRT
jgi:tRNA(fMet)-specific endonuclease VapC